MPLVLTFKTTQRYKLEDQNMKLRRRENIKPHTRRLAYNESKNKSIPKAKSVQ
jgi:hypothetical protein